MNSRCRFGDDEQSDGGASRVDGENARGARRVHSRAGGHKDVDTEVDLMKILE